MNDPKPPTGPASSDRASVDPASIDPVTLEVYRHLFTALAEEMGAALRRAAFSPNIKERRDYSCALFDARGVGVAMGDHMPVHLGAMPMSVSAALEELEELQPGDVVCLNDPFRGGTHLPDITLLAPVHAGKGGESGESRSVKISAGEGGLLGYVAARAHHADVGGSTPGSMPLAREIHEEGLRIPPVRIVEGDRKQEDLWRLILSNVR
ncbi:MAG: hydantoinase B/oxoprolinase family protein, partial [Longimicrobiales bacterium]|nr:hydantoinase B/oxoprolinase family protein [Longimicrobiales bacterium]